MKRPLAVVLVLAAIWGCTEHQANPPSVGRPAALILDGAHNGDPNFFFLPPLVANPINDPHFIATAFDGTLVPTVEVCRLTGDPRTPPSGGVFCAAGTPVFGPVNATLDATNQQYVVNWDTKAPPGLDATQFYRIGVRGAAGKSVLGSLDVDPVDQGFKNLRTGDVVQFQDGRTLPIKFRIQQGEQCTLSVDCVTQTVGAGGATIVTSEAGGGVTGGGVFIPVGALNAGEEITVTISKLLNTPCLAGLDLPQFEGCYRFTANPPLSGRAGGAFNIPVILAICVELPVTITHAQEDQLQLYAFDVGQGVRVLPNAPAGFLPCEPNRFPTLGNTGSRVGWRGMLDRLASLATPQPAYAAMVHLGVGGSSCCFSDVIWGLPAEDAVSVGNGQTAVSGTAVPIPPAVLVTDGTDANSPVAGATVHFRIPGEGGGSVTPTQVVTGADGIARVTSWVLGQGTNRLEAFATGIGPAPTFPITSGFLSEGVVPFTATGVTITTTVTDPAGDAGAGNPDLVSGTASAGNGNLTLSLQFAPETFDPATTHALFDLDIDENPATGFQGIDNGGHDTGVLGVDYLVFMGSASEAGNATILRFNGEGFTTVGTVPVSFSTDGMSVVIPLSLLGNDDGQMTFRVEVQTQLTSAPTYTAVLDWMPDTTLPPGRLEIPAPSIP
jgi:hypothetical protein